VLSRLRALKRPASAPIVRQTYPSYAAALEDCSGYEVADLLDVIAAKTGVVRDDASAAASESDLHGLLALTTCALHTGKGRINVLDFGGACGAHYYTLRRLLPNPALNWVIVETPGMAERANRLVPHDASLAAVDSVAAGVSALNGTVDLVHASGALQCTPDPYAALASLLQAKAPVLMVTRGAVTAGSRDVIVVHESSLASNGPGALPPQFQDRAVSYPFVFASRERLLAQLRGSYRRILILPDHTGHFPVNQEPVCGFAALCSEPW